VAKRAYAPQYVAEDKDILDLLASERRSLTTKKLLQVARERGIFLSESESWEKLAKYISCLPFDWPSLKRLFAMTEREDRSEKKTSSIIATKAVLATALDAVESIKTEREGVREDAFAIKRSGNVLTVDVGYTEVDESRTRLNQRRSRKLTIEIEQTPDGIKFRHDANERAAAIVEEIIEHLVDDAGEVPLRRIIDLSGIRAPDARTAFFLALMQGLKAHDLKDVSSVSVDRLPTGEDSEGTDDTEAGEDLVAGTRLSKPEDAEMTAVVRHVLLRGDKLLDSREYRELTKNGFFVSRAVWTVEDTKTLRRVEFEAEFDDGPHATGFRYGVRGVFERKENGDLKKTRKSLSEFEKRPLVEALEDAAQRALASAEASAKAPLLPPLPPVVTGPK